MLLGLQSAEGLAVVPPRGSGCLIRTVMFPFSVESRASMSTQPLAAIRSYRYYSNVAQCARRQKLLFHFLAVFQAMSLKASSLMLRLRRRYLPTLGFGNHADHRVNDVGPLEAGGGCNLTPGFIPRTSSIRGSMKRARAVLAWGVTGAAVNLLNDASCAVLAQTRWAVNMTDPGSWPQASAWLAGPFSGC
jgi:hypothetical protein